jgi:hypothetical protein
MDCAGPERCDALRWRVTGAQGHRCRERDRECECNGAGQVRFSPPGRDALGEAQARYRARNPLQELCVFCQARRKRLTLTAARMTSVRNAPTRGAARLERACRAGPGRGTERETERHLWRSRYSSALGRHTGLDSGMPGGLAAGLERRESMLQGVALFLLLAIGKGDACRPRQNESPRGRASHWGS